MKSKNQIKKIGVTQYIEDLQKASVRLDLIRFHLMSIIGSKNYFSRVEEINTTNLIKLDDNINNIEKLIGELLKDVDPKFMQKINNNN